MSRHIIGVPREHTVSLPDIRIYASASIEWIMDQVKPDE
jgi:hypothetical protein